MTILSRRLNGIKKIKNGGSILNQENTKSIMNDNIPNKVLSKKVVFQSKKFRIERVEIERNGKIFSKDMMIRDPHVIILPLTKNNDLYLLNQYRDALQRVNLEAVAGFIDGNEDPLTSAKRELKEETGLEAKEWQQIADFNVSPNMISRAYVFVAKDLEEGKPELEDDEEIELIKIPLSEAIEKVVSGEMNTSSHAAVILLFDKLLQEGKITI